jgi:uncharacterized OsmC-like protein
MHRACRRIFRLARIGLAREKWQEEWGMDLSTESVEIITKSVAARETMTDPERIRGVTRIEITPGEGHSHHANRPGDDSQVIVVDEPTERGGSGLGPAPLGYFLTGVGACLLHQFINISIAERYALEFPKMNVRGDYHRDVGGGYQHIMQEIYAEGTMDQATMAKLAERAEGFCYIHNTLKHAIKMTTVVYLNDEECVRRVSEPGD